VDEDAIDAEMVSLKSSRYKARDIVITQRSEHVAASVLQDLGFAVTNLNDLVGNCPFADLLARKDSTRLLVQVKATQTRERKFATPPRRTRALATISVELGCHPIYAFVNLYDQLRIKVRFDVAARVAELADAAEAANQGRFNLFHVTFDQFTVEPEQLDELLRSTSPTELS
jgi:Holliday junction resolvase-like predicted endonuclease